MNTTVLAIAEPNGLNLLLQHDASGELVNAALLSDRAYRREVGGMKGHYALMRQGAVRQVHYLDYERERFGLGVDEIGRTILTIDLPMLIALANTTEERRLDRIFLYRSDIESAQRDQRHLVRFLNAAAAYEAAGH